MVGVLRRLGVNGISGRRTRGVVGSFGTLGSVYRDQSGLGSRMFVIARAGARVSGRRAGLLGSVGSFVGGFERVGRRCERPIFLGDIFVMLWGCVWFICITKDRAVSLESFCLRGVGRSRCRCHFGRIVRNVGGSCSVFARDCRVVSISFRVCSIRRTVLGFGRLYRPRGACGGAGRGY